MLGATPSPCLVVLPALGEGDPEVWEIEAETPICRVCVPAPGVISLLVVLSPPFIPWDLRTIPTAALITVLHVDALDAFLVNPFQKAFL